MDAHPPPEEPAPEGRRRTSRRSAWVLITLGLVLVVGVGAWQLYATLWTAHSNAVGHALVHRFNQDLKNRALESPVTGSSAPTTSTPGGAATSTSPGSATLAACQASGSSGSSTAVHGLLEIPKLGVVAPVEQGVGDGVLAVAVGHDPHSVWPGDRGNAVLEAHDVSYFTSIDQLSPGDAVRFVTPCTTYDFRVSTHAVVAQGSPVYDTATPTVTLVTCWPTDALWFTPDRYLVTATEVSSSPTGSRTPYLEVTPPPSVPVPGPLASQGVTLATYSLPMGTFTLSGTPSAAWAQTTSPLLVEGSAVEAFIAGVRALTENRLDWWSQLAPGVTAPPPLVGAANPGYLSPTDVTETASGTTVTSVTLHDTVSVSGGSAPGHYAMVVTERVHDHTLVISSWAMSPA